MTLTTMATIIATVIVYGGSLLLLLAILRGVLWGFTRLSRALLDQLWGAELVSRTVVSLWYRTRVRPPKDFHPLNLRFDRPAKKPHHDPRDQMPVESEGASSLMSTVSEFLPNGLNV